MVGFHVQSHNPKRDEIVFTNTRCRAENILDRTNSELLNVMIGYDERIRLLRSSIITEDRPAES
jgi:hypothetical protein